MEYRYLGNTGIQVSVFSYGNMMALDTPEGQKFMTDSIKKSLDMGINYFDNAEIYGMFTDDGKPEAGRVERMMGKSFKELKVKREEIVISTKLFKIGQKPNDGFMSRKHIIEGCRNSLKRLQLDYVDILFSHRPDYETPLEETCRAFSWCID